jgi:CO/xanthine dehydrogenase Mo-binding subunit
LQNIAIGQSIVRLDARGKVTGETPYPSDFDVPGQLWMKIKWSDRAHARIRAIDTSKALALPGVHGVFTAADVPVNEYAVPAARSPEQRMCAATWTTWRWSWQIPKRLPPKLSS